MRTGRLDYHNPEFELDAEGCNRTKSLVDRKQPVTISILLKMQQLVNITTIVEQLLWVPSS